MSFIITAKASDKKAALEEAAPEEATAEYSDMMITLRKIPGTNVSQDFVRNPYLKKYRRPDSSTSVNNFRNAYGCLARGVCRSNIDSVDSEFNVVNVVNDAEFFVSRAPASTFTVKLKPKTTTKNNSKKIDKKINKKIDKKVDKKISKKINKKMNKKTISKNKSR
ncbi:MAG: hypothetical protein AABY53_03380 [Bdellovibrionota bacterium]